MRKSIASMMAIIVLASATISCATQHDMVVDNATAAAVRADINSALGALVTNNSGATEPATKYAYQWWADTTTGYMKLRNAANNAWITTYLLANGPLPHTGATTVTTLGTITTGTWTAGRVAAAYDGMAVGAVYGANATAGGYGVYGVGTNGATALMGLATTGSGLYTITTTGTAANINTGGTQTANSTNPTLQLTRNPANAGYTTTGNIIDITDTPTGAGAISGSLIKAVVAGTERLNYNPRVTDGASAVAYMMDTNSALTNAGANLLSIRNNGTEQFAVAHNGALKLKSGANKSIGQATLVGGTVTVSNTAITANSRIFVTVSTSGGTRGHLSVTKSAGVSFTITSSSGTDTSVVDYHIIESLP